MIVDIALLVTITAFFKEQLGLTGKSVLAAAFVVGLALFLSPQLIAAFPAAGPWLSGLVDYIKLFLGAAGSIDLVPQLASKIARARQ